MKTLRNALLPVALLFLALVLVACGSTQHAGRSSSGVTYAKMASTEGAAPAEALHSADADRASPSSPADGSGRAAQGSASSEGEAPSRVEKKERPGLGTVFGETRSSPVQRKSFERASETPFETLVLNYNDESGLRSQMAYRGGAELASVFAQAAQGGLTVALLDESGRAMTGRSAGGRTYVAGRAGDRYAIQVRNTTGQRVEVVASVDGLDVVDGRPSTLSKRGYLLAPNATLVIDGFRRSDDAVAAFRFGKVKESYAARTGSDRNVGVIGLAFFDEKNAEWTREEVERRETATPFPADPRYAAPPPPLAE